MISTFETTLALRYLRPARREGFVSVITGFSILGIMLGVATLILVTSLMNGIRAEMTRLFIGIDGPVSIMMPAMPVADAAELAATIEASEQDVTYVLPKLEGQLMATSGGVAQGVQVVAVYGDDFSQKDVLSEHIPASFDGLLLGERLARNLGVKSGDTLKLIAPQGRHTIAGFIPKIKTYRVAGTFKLGMHLYDGALIVMPFKDAQLFFKPPNADEPLVAQLEVGLSSAEFAHEKARHLQRTLSGDVRVDDWQRSNSGLFAALDVQRNVMVVILTLIILVAAFNIISSLIMLVQDKRTDMAILRTMGATRAQLMRAFCLTGTLIGLVGTLIGVLLGLLAAENLEAIKKGIESIIGQKILVEQIYFLSTLPTKTDLQDVLYITIAAVVLSFLATIHPARRAASISPAEALRYG